MSTRVKTFFGVVLFLLITLLIPAATAHAASAFTDGTATYGIANGTTTHISSSWVDIDNDGDFDLYVVNSASNNKLFINNGAGAAMTDATATYGIADGTSAHANSSWVDIDNDGDMDLYSINQGGVNNHLFINNGPGVAMTDATATYGIADGTTTHTNGSWTDFDEDGDMDLYSTNSSANNHLFINNGPGVAMTDATATYGIADGTTNHQGASWVDIDSDGDPDLYTINVGANNHLFINNGPGVAMTDATTTYGIADGTTSHTSASFIDVDNDGDLDLYSVSINANGHLFINNGAGVAMTDATATYGIADGTTNKRGPSWIDIDNDGDLDLYTVNLNSNNHLFINNGPEVAMTDATATYGIADGTTQHINASWIDIENDGDLDLYSLNQLSTNNHLFINPGQGNNYLKFTVNNDSDLYQYNSRVEVDRDGNNDFSTGGDLSIQYQINSHYGTTGSNVSQDPAGLFFGLGSSTECIYDVRVFLPGVSPSGSPSYSQENICPNQSITVPFVAGTFTVAAVPTAVPTSAPASTSSGGSSSASAPAIALGNGGTVSGSTGTSITVEEGAIPFASNLSSNSISSHQTPTGIRTASCGVGDIQQIWLTDYYNGARILPSVQNKPSIIALRYNQFQLLKTGGGAVPERSLKVSYSSDGKTWNILSTSAVDPVNNTVAAIHKIGGYFMITSCGNARTLANPQINTGTKLPNTGTNQNIRGVTTSKPSQQEKLPKLSIEKSEGILEKGLNFLKELFR